MKYILLTEGVHDGIGKDVASSIGALLKACDLNVTAIKINPHIKMDTENEEVFVLNDGCEVSMDLGIYEMFLDTDLGDLNYMTTGKIYQQVIDRERKGDYLGKTMQIIPHVTDAIQEWIEKASKTQLNGKKADICIIELVGTIGSLETLPFIEALRQLQRRVKRENFCCVHVTPVLRIGREYKIGPTQESVAKISSLGIHPDMIVCRSDGPMDQAAKDKTSMLCDVEPTRIFHLTSSVNNIYQVPIELERQRFVKSVSSCLDFHACTCHQLDKWEKLVSILVNAEEEIIVTVVGDYPDFNNSYSSVARAIEHACFDINAKPDIRFIDSALLEDNDSPAWERVRASHCIIVPGGFKFRGFEGKIKAISYARVNKMPFLGIGLGFQLAAIEFARSKLEWNDSYSEEFKKELKGTKFAATAIVIEMKDSENKLGGTMRLGLRKTLFGANSENSIVRKMYDNKLEIEERHRHHYEIDSYYFARFQETGSVKFVGKSEDGTRADILELNQEEHPYFVGCSFQPEYLSRPFKPSPLYLGLVEAAKAGKKKRDDSGYDSFN